MPESANPIKASFDQDFCDHLEYHLSRAFNNAPGWYFKQFWCDGIDIPEEHQLTIKNITGRQKIKTAAWFGETGQERYQMIIKLGRKSINRSLKGLSLIECFPASSNDGSVISAYKSLETGPNFQTSKRRLKKGAPYFFTENSSIK